MIRISKRHLLLPLLALGMTVAMAATVYAQTSTSASLTVSFGTAPHWTAVQGTRVQVIRDRERPDYDMFRYGGSYYVYNNDRWYMSRRSRGQFRAIDERQVPVELSRVPRNHWRNYPTAWAERDNRHDNGNRRHGNQGNPGNSGNQGNHK
jgi:hypothetical protein